MSYNDSDDVDTSQQIGKLRAEVASNLDFLWFIVAGLLLYLFLR